MNSSWLRRIGIDFEAAGSSSAASSSSNNAVDDAGNIVSASVCDGTLALQGVTSREDALNTVPHSWWVICQGSPSLNGRQ